MGWLFCELTRRVSNSSPSAALQLVPAWMRLWGAYLTSCVCIHTFCGISFSQRDSLKLHIHTFSYVHSGIPTDAARSISDRSLFQQDNLLTTLIVVLFIDFQHTFKQVCVLLLFLCLCVCVCVWTAVRHGQCSIGWIPHVFPFSARHPCTGIFFSIKRPETLI
jgi:Ca2+/Na+ antiporter